MVDCLDYFVIVLYLLAFNAKVPDRKPHSYYKHRGRIGNPVDEQKRACGQAAFGPMLLDTSLAMKPYSLSERQSEFEN